MSNVTTWQEKFEQSQINFKNYVEQASIEKADLRNEVERLQQRIVNLEYSNEAHRKTAEDWRSTAVERDALRAQVAKMQASLERIAKCEDAPAVDATGEWQTGLHCGVEDRDCRDRYDGADYGHAVGVEKALEWASNEAKSALATP